MSTTVFSAVTVLDNVATSTGLADATPFYFDYRFCSANQQFSIVGTKTSAGADNVILWVSADATKDYPNGTYAQLDSNTSTSWAREVFGPWTAVKVGKTGTQAVRVIGLFNGYNRNNNQT